MINSKYAVRSLATFKLSLQSKLLSVYSSLGNCYVHDYIISSKNAVHGGKRNSYLSEVYITQSPTTTFCLHLDTIRFLNSCLDQLSLH